MDTDDLTLTSIDGQRHLTTSEEIIHAAAFPIRLGHTVQTTYRFVTAVVMLDELRSQRAWPTILRRVLDLQTEGTRP